MVVSFRSLQAIAMIANLMTGHGICKRSAKRKNRENDEDSALREEGSFALAGSGPNLAKGGSPHEVNGIRRRESSPARALPM
jgi:hypothetical protein